MEILERLFHLYKHYEDAGEIWMVDGLDMSKPDTQDIVHIADSFARMGSIVMIPHPVHYKSETYALLFGGLIGTKFERKCPDLIVDGDTTNMRVMFALGTSGSLPICSQTV